MPKQVYAPGAPAGRIESVLEKLGRVLRRHESPKERRAQRRIPIHGAARMLSGAADSRRGAVVHMVDISEMGLAVRAACPVPVGDPILLSDAAMTISGVVRHCTKDGKEFTIGVQLSPAVDEAPQYAFTRLLEA
jgi:hypothetical protein